MSNSETDNQTVDQTDAQTNRKDNDQIEDGGKQAEVEKDKKANDETESQTNIQVNDQNSTQADNNNQASAETDNIGGANDDSETSSVESDDNDRFRTYWSGPYHPVAMQWAADHGISFDGPGRVFDVGGRGVFLISGGLPGGDDQPAADLRVENDKYDDEVRAHHAADTDLHTGNLFYYGDSPKWALRTRGEKLRECKFHIRTYTRYFDKAQEKMRILKSSIDGKPESETADE